MDSDLMHPPCPRSAEDDACSSIETETLELRVAVLAVWTNLADADLVAHNLDRLLAAQRLSEKQKRRGHENFGSE
jgi:hypothetical protein